MGPEYTEEIGGAVVGKFLAGGNVQGGKGLILGL